MNDDDAADAGVPFGHVLLSTTCWSCGQRLGKLVRFQQRHHQQFRWSCDACDVGWTGPGVELPHSA